ncbi:MAG: polysaccharide deacetylase family protein [Deltaproteobacteria bacterium]
MLRRAYRFCRQEANIVRNVAANKISTPVIVLLYHRVTTLCSDPQLLSVCPANFRAHLKVIKDNFPVLRFDDDWSNVREPSVVITFDDGYADNALEVLPILEETNIPATFFISLGYIGKSEEFWWDELERIILLQDILADNFKFKDKTWELKNEKEINRFYTDMHLLIKKMEAPRREELIKYLRGWANISEEGRESHKPVSIKQLKKLSGSSLVTIGAHSVTHSCLANQTLESQKWEIEKSKSGLEDFIGKEVKVFSYPFGGLKDYTKQTAQLVKEAGFIKAASNFSGQWHYWSDSFQIPRHIVRNWDGETFEKYLKRFWIS